MNQLSRYRKLLAYDDWANREALRSLNSAPENTAAAARAVRLLGHIIGSQWLWLRRLGAPGGEMAVWPDLQRGDCEAQLDLLAVAWERYLETGSQEQLSDRVTYLNSKRESWSSRIEDILEHVVMHGAYHRGQVAAALRSADITPAYTDFIHAIRSGAIRDEGPHRE